jgi:hypothetical protein
MARFKIVFGQGPTPKAARDDAEQKVRKAGAGWEPISIAADVVFGGGGSPYQDRMLSNIAKNIYQLVQCTCPTKVGVDIKKPGFPPATTPFPAAPPSFSLWVVYVLLRHK